MVQRRDHSVQPGDAVHSRLFKFLLDFALEIFDPAAAYAQLRFCDSDLPVVALKRIRKKYLRVLLIFLKIEFVPY